MTPVRPRHVSPGSTLGIFSPSEPLTDDRRERMRPSLELLHKNFQTYFADNAFAQNYYSAGTVRQRIDDIKNLLENDRVHLLLASWGGKSCNQLLDRLPYELLLNARKPVVGFSDACVLLNAITATTGLYTFFGPNIAGKMHESDHWDLRLIRGDPIPPFGESAKARWTTLVQGIASGRLFGGNLSTFALGLSSEIVSRMEEPIFFFESASDPPQIIHQYLVSLNNLGFLSRCKAIIVGDIHYEHQPPPRDRPINDLLVEVGTQLKIPVVRVETFGHKKLENPAIPIGAITELNTDARLVTTMEDVVE